MNRILTVLAGVAVVLVAAAAGVGAWVLTRDDGPSLPEISAFTHGHLERVGPYLYCNVVDLNDCQDGGHQGELTVNHSDPVQLSVPAAIGAAPWRLILAYEEIDQDQIYTFSPGEQLAVTIATVDPQRGRLTGFAVQLPTLVELDGELREIPHAEWSVRTVWQQREGTEADPES
ncbi:DUF2771 domain-containing protein [[Mycobacterium] burgundiense]|jgi:hypothetical protein|uniref:DUF2771 domain-containing protein n=1 Tax=[Mycobacterium] burgundiense TaxID=3064286 RepID=A0ABM9LCG1_9MYCO|nr:DUF2771 domain-containing protein [Mycolicibacterium sp. MU0053]CAJ1496659.1 DUF2771 domain-containing protein [Mycolicibacterium sp. MU0053]